MKSSVEPIRLVILGSLPEIPAIIEKWRRERTKDIHTFICPDFDEFLTFEFEEQDVILMDLKVFDRDPREIVYNVKKSPPISRIVLIAEVVQSDETAELLRAGVDEYVLRTSEDAYWDLLLETLQRATNFQRDLPFVVEGVSESHFWSFLDAAPIPMKVLDDQGTLLHINPATSTFLNREREELVGRPIFDFMHEGGVAEAKESFNQLIQAGPPKESNQAVFDHHVLPDRRYRRKDGQDVVWANLYLMPLWNPDSSLLHIVGFMVDITERKQSMMALEKRDLRERAIVETTADGILTIDEAGKLELFNHACEEMFGYDSSEVTGEPVEMLIPKDYHDLIYDSDLQTLNERVEIEGLQKNGNRFPLEISVGEATIGKEKLYTVILRDITEQKELQDRIYRSERMEAVGQLAGGIAHDFNNILTIINTHAYLLSLTEDHAAGEAQEYVQKILSATERGTRLTQQLLGLSPSPMGEPEAIDLNEAVAKIEHLFESVIEEDIDISTHLGDELPPVLADLSQIEQILLNLIINARDAMPKGGKITIETDRAIIPPTDPEEDYYRGLAPGEYAVLRVRDTGMGVPRENQDRIFDPYFTTKEPGTGLGLATVYNILERHGGKIDLESTGAEGSVFAVYLPAHYEYDKVTAEEQKISTPRTIAQGERILVVEDEADIRDSLVSVLLEDGYDVVPASSGEEALRIAKKESATFDLVVTDLVMPGMNGVELAEALVELNPSIRIIFVSGYAGDVLQRKNIELEQAHLSKPYDLELLKDAVQDLLQ